MRRRIATGLGACMAAVALLCLQGSPYALADDNAPMPGIQSPALVSTNPEPTVTNGATVPLEPRPGFRVLPYLQRPASNQMTVNWFTEQGHPSTLTITGPGLDQAGEKFTVEGIQNPVNAYQDAELAVADFDNGHGLITKQGEWIRADQPFKYSQLLTGLTPDSTYRYTVEVDGYSHSGTFTTPAEPGGGVTDPIHIMAFSDTETDPKGRTTYREWVAGPLAEGSEDRPGAGSAWDQKFGSSTRDGQLALNYMLTEDQAQEENNKLIAQSQPDLLLITGDIAERASSQTHWDEWFRYFSGDKGHLLDSIPSLPALGNHEVYGYGTPEDRSLVVRARAEFNQYFDTPGSSYGQYGDAFYRVDYGPVTVITLDSTKGYPDQSTKTVPDEQKITGDDSTLTPQQYGTDTQSSYTLDEYARDYPAAVEQGWFGPDADPTAIDQPIMNEGSDQWAWAEAQLKDARDMGQTIIVQFHHVAYSNGVHGTTMGHQFADGQPGTPMRVWEKMFEDYNVATVISGHDEMFEVSYVDDAADGTGIYHWDVGVASDGLRGEKMVKPEGSDTFEPLAFNTHSVWVGHRDEPEMWKTDANGVKQLVSGGKHYGHLDMQLSAYQGNPLDTGVMPTSTLVMTPIAMFPVLDDQYNLDHVESRAMTDGQQIVYLDENGNPLAGTPTPGEPEPTQAATTKAPSPATPSEDVSHSPKPSLSTSSHPEAATGNTTSTTTAAKAARNDLVKTGSTIAPLVTLAVITAVIGTSALIIRKRNR